MQVLHILWYSAEDTERLLQVWRPVLHEHHRHRWQSEYDYEKGWFCLWLDVIRCSCLWTDAHCNISLSYLHFVNLRSEALVYLEGSEFKVLVLRQNETFKRHLRYDISSLVQFDLQSSPWIHHHTLPTVSWCNACWRSSKFQFRSLSHKFYDYVGSWCFLSFPFRSLKGLGRTSSWSSTRRRSHRRLRSCRTCWAPARWDRTSSQPLISSLFFLFFLAECLLCVVCCLYVFTYLANKADSDSDI